MSTSLYLDYDEIDWFGAEKYMNFVNNIDDVTSIVEKCVNNDDGILKKVEGLKLFMDNQHKIFLSKLEGLINGS